MELDSFLEAGGLASELAQIVQLRAAYLPGAHHIDMIDNRRMHGENALHAVAEAHLANRDGLAHSGILAGNHRALERLQTLLVAFSDSYVNANGVAGPKLGMRRFAAILADKFRDKCVLHISSAFPHGRPESNRDEAVLFSRATQPGASA